MADAHLLNPDTSARRLLLASAGLAFVAGYADTASFVGADGIFCAHVTGNFVVLAADLARGAHASDWLKLSTFPLFVLAVAVTTRLTRGGAPLSPRTLVSVSVALLTASAALAAWAPAEPNALVTGTLVGAMVLAMGVQNAMHRLHPSLGPMTTVMTGNVTGFVAELVRYAKTGGDASKLRLGGALIVAFTLGCLGGAFGTHYVGLASVVVPAMVLMGPVRASLPS